MTYRGAPDSSHASERSILGRVVRNNPVAVIHGYGLPPDLEASRPKHGPMFAVVRHVCDIRS